MADAPRIEPLHALDLAQTRAAVVIAQIAPDDLPRPTPCTEWSVRDIVNKLVASTIVFTAFARREAPDASLDLVHPRELIGDDPLGIYLEVALACRQAWRAPGALEGTAPSTVGEFPAKAVLNARIFDTTVLTTDLARACRLDHGIDDAQAAYVLRVAERLVPTVRSVNPARYRDATPTRSTSPLDQLLAVTGRDLEWEAPA